MANIPRCYAIGFIYREFHPRSFKTAAGIYRSSRTRSVYKILAAIGSGTLFGITRNNDVKNHRDSKNLGIFAQTSIVFSYFAKQFHSLRARLVVTSLDRHQETAYGESHAVFGFLIENGPDEKTCRGMSRY